MQECVKRGWLETLRILLDKVPILYRIMKEHFARRREQEQGSGNEQVLDELIGRSAKWGRFFAYPESYLDSLPETVASAERWRILIFLHRWGSQWLRQILAEPPRADTGYKQRLCEELCEGLGKIIALAEDWKKADYKPLQDMDETLRARHWCLLGDLILRATRKEQPVSEKMIDGICHESFMKAAPEEYLSFYGRNPSVDEMSPWFSDLAPEQQFITGPLSGTGHSNARWVPQHGEEMRCAFLWIVANSRIAYRQGNLPPVIPISLDLDALCKTLQQIQQMLLPDFGQALNAHKLRPPRDGEHWIIEWLRGCNKAFDRERGEKVASAEPLPLRITDFLTEFQENCEKNLVVAKFLVRSRAFEIDLQASGGPWKAFISKKHFLDPAGEGYTDNSGAYYGAMCARSIDYALANQFITEGRLVEGGKQAAGSGTEKPAKSQGSAPDSEGQYLLHAVERAVDWLRSCQCPPNQGFICVTTNLYVEGVLGNSEHFERLSHR